MKQAEAFAILDIPADVSARDLAYITKAYRVASLKHHPDKNENSPESTARFQKITEAYHYLTSSITAAASVPPPSFSGAVSYQEIFVFFIRTMFARTGGNDAVDSADIEAALMHIVSSNYDKLLKTLDKSTAVAVYEFMHEYADVLHLPEETLEKMFKIVSDKMKSDNLVILNPTLSDVFQKRCTTWNTNQNALRCRYGTMKCTTLSPAIRTWWSGATSATSPTTCTLTKIIILR